MPWATTFVEALEPHQIVRNQPNGILCSNTLPQHLGQQEEELELLLLELLLLLALRRCLWLCLPSREQSFLPRNSPRTTMQFSQDA